MPAIGLASRSEQEYVDWIKRFVGTGRKRFCLRKEGHHDNVAVPCAGHATMAEELKTMHDSHAPLSLVYLNAPEARAIRCAATPSI